MQIAHNAFFDAIISILKNGEVGYESVNEMNYMEMVVNETLRMFPPSVRVDRVCNKNYEFGDLKIPKGQIWTVPIWALHHDPDLYPEPENFDPERFNEANKKKRENEAFIPFGAGPRNCIGMRFALLEIKLLLATILSKYKFNKCDQTPVRELVILLKVWFWLILFIFFKGDY